MDFSQADKGKLLIALDYRLGHCSSKAIERLKLAGLMNTISDDSQFDICNSCQVAKAAQLPFVDVVVRQTFLLLKIHNDVWGPVPIVSVENFKYYVSFVDDCTRCTWLYPLYNKFGFFSTYTLFEKLVQR